jgi:tetratricopeptide (TPR) repeat protein
MEGTRTALIQEVVSPVVETPRLAAVLFWHSSLQLAAERRLKLLSNMRDQPAQIDQEYANFHASMDWLKKQSERTPSELLLAYLGILEPYLHLRGHDTEFADWCLAGLDACERLRRNPAQILLMLGNAQYSLGQWKQAEASWNACIAASREIDLDTHARTTYAIGRLQINQGKYRDGLKTLVEAESLLVKIGDTQSIIGVRSEIAAYHQNRRELKKALKLYLEIDKYYKKNGGKESSDNILLMLGVIYRQTRVFDKAIGYLSELCRRGETQKNMSSLATGSHHLAWVYFEMRNLEQARQLCGKALALYNDLRDPRGLSDGYEQLGAILTEEGKLKEAIDSLEQSIQVRKQIGNDPGSISSLRRLALAYMLEGRQKLAIQLSIQAVRRYIQLGILSPQRVAALAKDFITGITKVILFRSNENKGKSVMESFSRALMQPKKHDQAQDKSNHP